MTSDKEAGIVGSCTSPTLGGNVEQDSEDDIIVNQKEDSVEIEFQDDISEEQLLEAEAYSMLFALGGYTYSNLQEEDSTPEVGNNVEEGKEEANDDDADGDDDARSSTEVDEEALINQKSPYEQQFIGLTDLCLVKPSTPIDFCNTPQCTLSLGRPYPVN